jgi:hypothetical protein
LLSKIALPGSWRKKTPAWGLPVSEIWSSIKQASLSFAALSFKALVEFPVAIAVTLAALVTNVFAPIRALIALTAVSSF